MSCKHEKYISTGVYSSDDECESCGLLRYTVEASKAMSLQKESEWEDEFYRRFQEEYPHLSDEQSEEIKTFVSNILSNREKEIAEEVIKLGVDSDETNKISVDGVLSILKH